MPDESETPEADFFVSYTQADRPWAEWISWQLEEAGYSVIVQAWDFGPGTDWAHKMQDAATSGARVVAVLSDAYLASKFGQAEWLRAWAEDPTGEEQLVVPVRISEVEPPGHLNTRVFVDLVGTAPAEAKELLLKSVLKARGKPATAPPFPGGAPTSTPHFPGQGPETTNLPPRNPNFTGRDDALEELRRNLIAESKAAIVHTEAIHGLGGVGKTELALEYAYRYATNYRVIWWIGAELSTTATGALTALAARVGLPDLPDARDALAALFEWLRRNDGWLLIYDNAEQPDDLGPLLPTGGTGHVIITSRWSAWRGLGASVGLSVMPRRESVEFLRRRTGSSDDGSLDALADLVGDLPLALEEAGAYLEETGVGVDAYNALFRERARELFALGPDEKVTNPAQRRVATVWSVSLERVRVEEPGAEALLNLCAYLSPDDIPRDLLGGDPDVLPAQLRKQVSDPLAYNRVLAVIKRFSLADVTADAIGIHRLVQEVIRARLTDGEEREWSEAAVALVLNGFSARPEAPDSWDLAGRWLPHVVSATDSARRLGVASRDTAELLARASRYLRARGQPREAMAVAESALEVSSEDPEAHDLTVAARRGDVANCAFAIGDLARARILLEDILPTSKRLLGGEHPATLTTMNNLAVTLRSQGEQNAARELHETILAARHSALGDEHPDTLMTMNNLAEALRAQGHLNAVRKLHEQVLATSKRVLGDEHPNTLIAMNNLAQTLAAQGDEDSGRKLQEQTLATSRRVLGDEHPNTLTTMDNLAATLRAQGDQDSARKLHEQVLAISTRVLGDEHPNTLTTMNNLAETLAAQGDHKAARRLHEQTLAISKRVLGDEHPTTLIAMNNLAQALAAQGDQDAARKLHEQVLPARRRVLGDEHPHTLITMDSLAATLRAQGDHDAARQLHEQVVAISTRVLGEAHPDTLIALNNLAGTLAAQGDQDSAGKLHEQVLAARQRLLGDEHPDTLITMNNLAATLEARGDHDAARELRDRVRAIRGKAGR